MYLQSHAHVSYLSLPGVTLPGVVRVPLESPVSSEMNEEEESPDADLDYLDEYDSEEEKKQRRKKKVCQAVFVGLLHHLNSILKLMKIQSSWKIYIEDVHSHRSNLQQ